jgi:hypothetical protein
MAVLLDTKIEIMVLQSSLARPTSRVATTYSDTRYVCANIIQDWYHVATFYRDISLLSELGKIAREALSSLTLRNTALNTGIERISRKERQNLWLLLEPLIVSVVIH